MARDISSPDTRGSYRVKPRVALDSAGNALAIWQRWNGSTYIIEASVRPAGGTWQTPEALSGFGGLAFEPSVALDRDGNALAVWRRYVYDSRVIIQAAARPANGSWQPAEDLFPAGHLAAPPEVVFDPFGNAIAAWAGYDGMVHAVWSATRPVGGAWQAPEIISPGVSLEEARPHLAFDAAGNGFAVWSGWFRSNYVVQAAGYDTTGPVLSQLNVPTNARAGTRLSFSVRSYDIWSAPSGKPRWSFGDGKSASGWRVRHTYARAGRYTVSVKQADKAGNESRRAIKLVVTPARCVVPRIVGKTLTQAKAALKANHCGLGKVRRAYSMRVRKGRVLEQSPGQGRNLRRGARVNVVVSRGTRSRS
jgi:hypothetical protein